MSTLTVAKNIPINHNVSIRVIDPISGHLISQHTGHNAATNSLLTGVARYLYGDGVLNQAYPMLNAYLPRYISLGTMGLMNQDEDETTHLPTGIGTVDYSNMTYKSLSVDNMIELGYARYATDDQGVTYIINDKSEAELNELITPEDDEHLRFVDYLSKCPGYGADGYDETLNNNREYLGLGLPFGSKVTDGNIESIITNNCELITSTFPRVKISFRDVVPETESEIGETLDIVYSAMISTGALKQFRDTDKDYIFITEAGLWSRPDWVDGGDNGLLAGYRISPTNQSNLDMSIKENRTKLKQQIIRVGKNQVVQVIWKIQIGNVNQFKSTQTLYWSNWY